VKSKIDFSGLKVRENGCANVRTEDGFDPRKPLSKNIDNLGQPICKDALWRAYAYRATWFSNRLNGAPPFVHRIQGLNGKRAESPARLCQNDSTTKPIEKAHAQFGLQSLDLRGDVRLHRVGSLGGASKPQLLGKDTENLQLTNFHGLYLY
jgi:hypothetical protein